MVGRGRGSGIVVGAGHQRHSPPQAGGAPTSSLRSASSSAQVISATLPRKRVVPPPHRYALHRRRRRSSSRHPRALLTPGEHHPGWGNPRGVWPPSRHPRALLTPGEHHPGWGNPRGVWPPSRHPRALRYPQRRAAPPAPPLLPSGKIPPLPARRRYPQRRAAPPAPPLLPSGKIPPLPARRRYPQRRSSPSNAIGSMSCNLPVQARLNSASWGPFKPIQRHRIDVVQPAGSGPPQLRELGTIQAHPTAPANEGNKSWLLVVGMTVGCHVSLAAPGSG